MYEEVESLYMRAQINIHGDSIPKLPQCSTPELLSMGSSALCSTLALTILRSCVFLLFQGKSAESERLYERSQAICEKTLGPDHPGVATVLNGRALLLKKKVKAVRNGQHQSCGVLWMRFEAQKPLFLHE